METHLKGVTKLSLKYPPFVQNEMLELVLLGPVTIQYQTIYSYQNLKTHLALKNIQGDFGGLNFVAK